MPQDGDRLSGRLRRHARIRKKLQGLPQRPRLNVFRSNRHIYAQIINDVEGRTLVSASTLDAELRGEVKRGCTKAGAMAVGAAIARRAIKKEIQVVVLDRGGYRYHGRIRALAEAAREAGLKF